MYMYAKACTSMQNHAQLSKIMLKYAETCSSMQKHAQVCKSTNKYAQRFVQKPAPVC